MPRFPPCRRFPCAPLPTRRALLCPSPPRWREAQRRSFPLADRARPSWPPAPRSVRGCLRFWALSALSGEPRAARHRPYRLPGTRGPASGPARRGSKPAPRGSTATGPAVPSDPRPRSPCRLGARSLQRPGRSLRPPRRCDPLRGPHLRIRRPDSAARRALPHESTPGPSLPHPPPPRIFHGFARPFFTDCCCWDWPCDRTSTKERVPK